MYGAMASGFLFSLSVVFLSQLSLMNHISLLVLMEPLAEVCSGPMGNYAVTKVIENGVPRLKWRETVSEGG